MLTLASMCAALLRAPPPRSPLPVMGGFEGQQFRSHEGGRVSLRVAGSSALLEELPAALRSRAAPGLTGVVYGLDHQRLEVIAEGERALLEPLVEFVEEEVEKDGAECRLSWQLPGGGYAARFPLVRLGGDMQATVGLEGEQGIIENYNRHVQVEAVFNRGLKVKSKRLTEGRLEVVVTGDANRLKSFVRWCYNGPRLARADKVTVEWGEL